MEADWWGCDLGTEKGVDIHAAGCSVATEGVAEADGGHCGLAMGFSPLSVFLP